MQSDHAEKEVEKQTCEAGSAQRPWELFRIRGSQVRAPGQGLREFKGSEGGGHKAELQAHCAHSPCHVFLSSWL